MKKKVIIGTLLCGCIIGCNNQPRKGTERSDNQTQPTTAVTDSTETTTNSAAADTSAAEMERDNLIAKEDSVEEFAYEAPSSTPSYAVRHDTCYAITKEDPQYAFFKKEGVTKRDDINSIYQYKDCRFYWDSEYECYLKVPKDAVCSGVFDHAGSKEFVLKEAGITIGSFVGYNLSECTRRENYQYWVKYYKENGKLLSHHQTKDGWTFEGIEDGLYFYNKCVFYADRDKRELKASLTIKYPKRSMKLGRKVIADVARYYPFKPF